MVTRGFDSPFSCKLLNMEAQENIVKALTEEPIIFEVKPIRVGLRKLLVRLRLVKKTRTFIIYPATAGMLEQMAEYSEGIKLKDIETIGDGIALFSEHSMKLYRFLAVAILRVNGGPVARVRVELLANYFHKNFSAKAAESLLSVVISKTDIGFFLSILKSVAQKGKPEEQKK